MENRLKAWCAGISDQVTPGTTTVVEGAPGTGKTAALDVLAARWEASGRLVVRARGSALEGDLPFGIIRSAANEVRHETVNTVGAA